MKRIISFFMAAIMLFSTVTTGTLSAHCASKVFVEDRLAEIQTTTGFIPGKAAAVQNNCYAFVSAICEELYGVPYQEGLYGNYNCKHTSGNFYTVATLTTGEANSQNVEKVIQFFLKYAAPGDIVHYGKKTDGTANTSTHTMMIQSIDNEKIRFFHSNYETTDYSRSSCHIDSVYWDSWRNNLNSNEYTSSGKVYSMNRIFSTKMNNGGMGVSINRYSKYNEKFYLVGAAIPIVSLSRASTTSIKVSWDKITSAEKYTVQYKKTGDSAYTTATNSCTATSFTVGSLETGESYSFRVRASVGGKWLSYSDLMSIDVLPPVISSVSFTLSKESIDMTWAKRSDITGVKIYRSDSEADGYKLLKTVSDNTVNTFSDTDIKSGKRYYYKFKRYIKIGSKEYSTTSNPKAFTYSLKAPAVTAENTSSTSLKFTINGDNLQDYYIYYLTDSSGNLVFPDDASDENVVEFDGLVAGKKYIFRCAEQNEIASSDFSKVSIRAVPAKPEKPQSELKSYGVRVSWSKCADADGYYIYRSTSKDGTYSKIGQTDNNKTLYFKDTTVQYNKTYYYKICNIINVSENIYTSVRSDAPAGTKVKLDKPVGVTVTLKTPTSLKVKWSAVENATSYVVEYKKAKGKWTSAGTTKSLSKTVSQLETGVEYSFRVRASNPIGTSYASDSKSKKPLPPKPAAPTASVVSGGIKIRWTPESYATGYKIYRAYSKDGKYTLVQTVDSNKTKAWTDKSVKKGSGYYYKIVCYKTRENVKYSSVKSDYVYKKYA